MSIEVNELAMDNAELGNLVDEYEKALNRLAELKAKLERIGEDLTLFANNLNQRPDTIRFEEPKLEFPQFKRRKRANPPFGGTEWW